MIMVTRRGMGGRLVTNLIRHLQCMKDLRELLGLEKAREVDRLLRLDVLLPYSFIEADEQRVFVLTSDSNGALPEGAVALLASLDDTPPIFIIGYERNLEHAEHIAIEMVLATRTLTAASIQEAASRWVHIQGR